MNKSPSFLTVAVSLMQAVCVLALVPGARAQQFSNMFPVANTAGTPDPAGTPSMSGNTPVNVENAPPATKTDPNAPTETEILATHGANFSSKDRIAIFEGDVRVNDTRFQLACDKLTVFLAKGAMGEGGATTPIPGTSPARPNAAVNSPPKPAEGQDASGGGIDHAVAEGNVIIIQKRPPSKPGEEEKISKGHADRADFDNKTGDMVLHGTPSVEQNGNVHLSLSPSTVMTLHKDNSMTTVGPNRTVIKGKAGTLDLPGSSPAASPAPGGQGVKKHPKSSGSKPG